MGEKRAFDLDQFKDLNLDKELENIINHPAPAYGEKDYWDSRYGKSDTFEWYLPWGRIKEHLNATVPFSGVAVNIGCGNSTMSNELVQDGFSKVVSIDFSDVLIQQMTEKYVTEPRLEWISADFTRNQLQSSFADVVFDKATIDTIICNDGSSDMAMIQKEVARILKPGGYFVILSYGLPNTRKALFGAGLTLIDTIKLEKPGLRDSHYYLYIAKRSE